MASLEQAEAGAKNRNEHDWFREDCASAGGERRFDVDRFRLPASRGFDEKEYRQFLEITAKDLGRGLLRAQDRKARGNERMIGHTNFIGGAHQCPSRIRTGDAGSLSRTMRRCPS